MNGFEKHGIKHSSPSAINMWASSPCAFIAKYILGQKLKFALAAKAGMLVEEAVVNVISHGWTHENALKAAMDEYTKAAAFGATDADLKRGDAIAGMIASALEELNPYGEPEQGTDIVYGKKQKKVEMICNGDGFKIPIIGYLDFHFPKHGLVVDLKTTMRLPSEMSDEHIRQGGFYRGAMGNQAVKFLYVSGKSHKWHEVPDAAPVLQEIKTLVNRQEKFLNLGDAATLQSFVPVNATSYYWTGDEQLRKSLYGI